MDYGRSSDELARRTLWQDLTPEQLEPFSKRPIFIVGSPRSGTTLLRSIIDAHPNIFCPPCETFLFKTLNTTFNGYIWDDHYRQLPYDRDTMIHWLRNWILQLFANLGRYAGKTRWAEKTPSHVNYVKFISEVFPDAQFIHMIRNGRDVVRSMRAMSWGKPIVHNAMVWRKSVISGRAAGEWLGPDRYYEIRFEELVRNPRDILQRTCDFLGEDYNDRMLEFNRPENNSWGLDLTPFKNANQIKQRNKYMNPFNELAFWVIAHSLMKELDY